MLRVRQLTAHHLNYNLYENIFDELNAKRVLLTHMGQEMFGRLDEVTLEVAEDGQLIEL